MERRLLHQVLLQFRREFFKRRLQIGKKRVATQVVRDACQIEHRGIGGARLTGNVRMPSFTIALF